MNDLLRSVRSCVDAVESRRVSAAELAAAAVEQATRLQPLLNACIDVFEEPRVNSAGLLAGVPLAIKDNICLDRGRTTCGSRMLEGYRSPFSATAATRAERAGATIIAKTNLDEFAMGSSGEHSAFGPTRNPCDPARVPGGSSSGSAAAVAAGIVPLALGSDTGGSVRQPAAFCGLVGFKPTYGRISRHGLVAYASSLDQVGTLTRNVEDAAAALSVLMGADPLDATSVDRPVENLAATIREPIAGLTIGVPAQAHSGSNHPDVGRALEDATLRLASRGARIVAIDLPMTDRGIAAYYIVAAAEASSNLARFDGARYGRRALGAKDLDEMYRRSRSEGLGAEVQRRIMLGTYVLSSGYYDAYYTTALRARTRVKADFDAAFTAGCHAVLMPTTPGPAWTFGDRNNDPVAMYLEDVYTVGVNLAGLPAVSVPSTPATVNGTTLPLGVQLIGPAFEEGLLLRIARLLEDDQ